MSFVDVFTQEQLDQALKNNDYPLIKGVGEFVISDSSQVTAYGSSQVRACNSSQVTACDSSQVRAYGSSQVRAYDSSQVTACGSSQVRASKYVAVTKQQGFTGKVFGGVVIEIPAVDTAEKWCEFYGAEAIDGIVTLYKAVDDDYATEKSRDAGIFYAPGSMPSAPDWDGGEKECGGGLHFSPSPAHALPFNRYTTKFVACPVKASEIVVHFPAIYPEKVKAPGVCAPCWEVGIDGNKIQQKEG